MKQTVVNSNGQSFTVEIKGRDIVSILERISVQTYEHLNSGDYIYYDERLQLDQLLADIGFGVINEENFEDYLQLWEPVVLTDETGSRKTVVLTVYGDPDAAVFKCYVPGSYFDIYEY